MWVRILLRALMFVSCGYCVLCRQRSLRPADHSFRAVLLGDECLVACDLETSTMTRFRAKLRNKKKSCTVLLTKLNWTAFDNVLCFWHSSRMTEATDYSQNKSKCRHIPLNLYSYLYQLLGIMVSVTPWVVVDGYQISGRKTINCVKCLNT
jgi:hypothetical protein